VLDEEGMVVRVMLWLWYCFCGRIWIWLWNLLRVMSLVCVVEENYELRIERRLLYEWEESEAAVQFVVYCGGIEVCGVLLARTRRKASHRHFVARVSDSTAKNETAVLRTVNV
jgi:hypothetical protein